MRWIGVGIGVLGIILFLVALSLEQTKASQTVLVQYVKGSELIGRPQKVLLDKGSKRVKGTGPDNSFFVEIDSTSTPFSNLQSIFALTKFGALVICALGFVGYIFESWRQKTAMILAGIPAEKLLD
jgi:hypothetical protein